MRLILILLAALALVHPAAAAPAPLRPVATIAGDGLRVTWLAARGAVLECVSRPGGLPLFGCARQAGRWRQGSVDINLQVHVGELLEVRAWDARGELLAVGQARVRAATYLPLTRR